MTPRPASLAVFRTLALAAGCAVMLAACAGLNVAATGSEAAEAERLRLVDRCMFASGQAASAREATAARCQCVARAVLSGVGEGEASTACARNPAAYGQATRRPRAKTP